MADIWTGDILLPDDTEIKDITFASQHSASTLHIPAPTLRFLAAVDTACIPLYLAAGPSFDVWTSSEETQSWFDSILVNNAASEIDASAAQPWWTYARSQSPIGILVSVDGGKPDGKSPRISEILFYGTIAVPAGGSFPTPPSSSADDGTPEVLPELRVHALPLSSDLLYKPSQSAGRPASPILAASDPSLTPEPQFLPSPFLAGATKPSSPKRKRDLFEEATQARKKARRKGGESVAAAAAKTLDNKPSFPHRRSISVDGKAIPFPDSRPGSAGGALSRPPPRPLSRSPSISSDIRPLSRKGAPDGLTKRSNLSQVATVPIHPEEPTTETRNKEALSRVVLAAMRMHGLQQRKKNRSRRGSAAPSVDAVERNPELSAEAAKEEAAKDEEFKVIYHQTYKGAALALRKHITTSPLHLHPDRLRPLVEKLLDIFCTDPLALPVSKPSDPGADILATPGNKKLLVPGSTHTHASPFDLPSGRGLAEAKAKARQKEMVTGSPLARGRGREDLMEGMM